jgi:hypothetical protein
MRKPCRRRAAGLHHMHTYHMLVEVSGDPQSSGGGKVAPTGAFDRPACREVV